MGMEHNFKKLDVWKRSIDLVEFVYQLTKIFPDEEKFGLISQMRRCSVSVASNIAEGSSRQTVKHFNHFLILSLGSVFELQTQAIIVLRLQYLNNDQYVELDKQLVILRKMLFGFQKTLKV